MPHSSLNPHDNRAEYTVSLAAKQIWPVRPLDDSGEETSKHLPVLLSKSAVETASQTAELEGPPEVTCFISVSLRCWTEAQKGGRPSPRLLSGEKLWLGFRPLAHSPGFFLL